MRLLLQGGISRSMLPAEPTDQTVRLLEQQMADSVHRTRQRALEAAGGLKIRAAQGLLRSPLEPVGLLDIRA